MSRLDEVPNGGELILLRRADVVDELLRADGLEDDVENGRSDVPFVARDDVDGFENLVHVSSLHRVAEELLSIRSIHLLDDRGCRRGKNEMGSRGTEKRRRRKGERRR